MTNLSNKLQPGTHISILTGSATAHCTIGTSHIHGTITKTTDKAIQIKAFTETDKEYTAWLPKKALVKDISKTSDINCRIANWFTPTGWTAKFFDIAAHHAVLSA